MSHPETDFTAWVDRLVQACLPLQLQRKLLRLEPLTKEEANRYVDVIALVTQARQFGQQGNVLQKLGELSRENKRQSEMLRETLWYASGKLPQYRPTDGRSIGVIKEAMVQTAISRILAGEAKSPRSILMAILGQYADIPGAYNELIPFLRQVERVLKKKKHSLKDMF